VEQITVVLQQAETGIPIMELCRQVGVSRDQIRRVLRRVSKTLSSDFF
jgi:hypothetical protein